MVTKLLSMINGEPLVKFTMPTNYENPNQIGRRIVNRPDEVLSDAFMYSTLTDGLFEGGDLNDFVDQQLQEQYLRDVYDDDLLQNIRDHILNESEILTNTSQTLEGQNKLFLLKDASKIFDDFRPDNKIKLRDIQNDSRLRNFVEHHILEFVVEANIDFNESNLLENPPFNLVYDSDI